MEGYIDYRIEAESVENGIKYPHCEKHKNKDGSNKQVVFSLDCASDTAIAEAVKHGRQEALKDTDMLCMELSSDCKCAS